MRLTLLLVASLCIAAVSADTFLVADLEVARKVNNMTGDVSAFSLDRVFTFEDTLNAGFRGFSLDDKTQTLYACDPLKHIVVKIQEGKVTNFVGISGTKGAIEGAVGVGSLDTPLDTFLLSTGDLLVADSVNNRIRKVTPDGTLSTVAGSATAGFADNAVGTSATFTLPSFIISASAADDSVYVASATAIRKMAPDFAVTTIAGAAAGVADGTGTDATFTAIAGIALSKNEKTLWTSTAQTTMTGSVIRKIDVASKVVTSPVGVINVATPSADGVGTNAHFDQISSLAMDTAGNLIIGEGCKNYGVLRKLDTTSLAVTTLTGDLTAAGCTPGSATGGVNVVQTEVQSLVDGAAADAKIRYPVDIFVVNEVCGKLYVPGSSTAVAECADLSSGSVPALKVSKKTTVTKALVVAGAATVASGVLTCNAPLTVNGALGVSGNGTLVVNDQAVSVQSISFGAATVYQVLVNKASPGIVKAIAAAILGGDVVLAISPGFEFGVGTTVQIIAFASKTGNFARTILIQLRGNRAARSLLAAPAATTSCGATSCSATGSNVAFDDDDEVPFIIALIVVGIIFVAAIAAGIFFASGGGKSSGKSAAPTTASTPYGSKNFDAEELSTVSSSSSSYAYDF